MLTPTEAGMLLCPAHARSAAAYYWLLPFSFRPALLPPPPPPPSIRVCFSSVTHASAACALEGPACRSVLRGRAAADQGVVRRDLQDAQPATQLESHKTRDTRERDTAQTHANKHMRPWAPREPSYARMPSIKYRTAHRQARTRAGNRRWPACYAD